MKAIFPKILSYAFLVHLFLACSDNSEELLIGTWFIDEVEILAEIDSASQVEVDKMKGVTLEFRQNGFFRMIINNSASKEIAWSLTHDTLNIGGQPEFRIIKLTQDSLMIQGKLSYLKDDEIIEQAFFQKMHKLP